MTTASKGDHTETHGNMDEPLVTETGVSALAVTDEATIAPAGRPSLDAAAMSAADAIAAAATDQDEDEREADRQAGAMGANLRQDVSAWAAGREGASALANAAPNPPPETTPAPAAPAKRAAARVRKPAAPVVEETAVKAVKKPYSMSYAGVTTAQHIRSMIERGAR